MQKSLEEVTKAQKLRAKMTLSYTKMKMMTLFTDPYGVFMF